MALPKVTPGTYDYGAYAKPTMVKYKGGQEVIGAAIAGAIQKGVETFTKTAAEIKQDKEAATSYKVRLTEQIDPSIKASNMETIKSHINEMGELEYLRKRGKISEEEYLNKKSNLDTTFQFLKSMPMLSDTALDGEIDTSNYKGENKDRNLGLHRALSSGNLRLEKDNKGGLIGKWKGVDDKEYSAEISDLVTNVDKYLDLKQRFNFLDSDKQSQLQGIADVVGRSKDIKNYMTDTVKSSSGTYEALNEQQATKGIAESSFIDAFIKENGEDIFEDVIKPTIANTSNINPDDIKYDEQAVRELVANQVAKKVQQTGVRVPEQKPVAQPTPEPPTSTEEIIATVNSGEADQKIKNLYELSYGRDLVEYRGNYIYAYNSQEEKDKGEFAQRIDVTDPLDMATALARNIFSSDSKYNETKLSFIRSGAFDEFYMTPEQKKAKSVGLKTN